MIRVLHINSHIVMNSGVMSVIMNYYKHIDRRNVQFDFVYFKENSTNSETYQPLIEELGGKVYFISGLNKIIPFRKALNELLKKEKYDIVHLHDAFAAGIIYKIIKDNGAKLVVHSHATRWSENLLHAARNYLLCCGLKRHSDRLFACSEAAGKFMFGKDAKFFLMKNAIEADKYKYDLAERQAVRAELCLGESFVVGHVGNFSVQKNHAFLVDIFERIQNQVPESRLLLVGDGSLRPEIEASVKGKGLDKKVIFLGRRRDVERIYQVMDVFILPSLYEGLPMVGVEAQSAGLPVVLSDTITRELGVTKFCYISLEDDVSIWAEKAIDFGRPSETERIEAAAAMCQRGFDIKTEVNKLAEEYENIVGEK